MKKLIILSSLIFALFGACTKSRDIASGSDLKTGSQEQESEILSKTNALKVSNYGRAWAWYDGSSAPDPYQFSSSGSRVNIRRISIGNYQVTFPGMGHLYNGVVHAVAYKGNHTAQVENWYATGTDLVANIKCFTPCGALGDGKFVVFFYKENRGASYNSAYLWSNSSLYHFNSKGLRNTLTRIGTGIYQVKFPGLQANGYSPGEKGNIIVTPYGSQPRRCQIGGWSQDASGITSTIYTYDGCGNPADATFSVSYISDFGIGQQGFSEDTDYGGYVWYDLNITPSLSYQEINYSSVNITVTRIGTGYYEVNLPYVIRNNISTTVIASSYGTDKSYVSVQSWNTNLSAGTTKIYIKCYASNGSLMNISSRFTLFFYSNENILF